MAMSALGDHLATLSSQPTGAQVTGIEFEPGTILVTRPLHELLAHVSNCELPSWTLLARTVSVLFMAIFRWHFCDNVLLERAEKIVHSIDGRVEIIKATDTRVDSLIGDHFSPVFTPQDLSDFNQRFPHMLDSSLQLKPKTTDTLPDPQTPHPSGIWQPLNQKHPAHVPLFDAYTEITPQTVSDYFRNFANTAITSHAEGNTIYSLLTSENLVVAQG
ncbi:MAG: hypothetical protein HYX48_02710 [Chlamydiales bacterium]|nr:hypothetical protein [Chlamydiales bacterium]